MPSRAEMRVWFEHALRGIVIASLAVMLWQSVRDEAEFDGEVVNASGIGGELADWSALPTAPAGIHVRLDSMPSPVERAWLSAIAGAGSRVAWSGDLPPVMMDAQPIASPSGGTRVVVGTPSRFSVVVSDDVGAIDTIRSQSVGATLTLGSVTGQLSAKVSGSVASTVQRDSVVLHKVLVIGNAGWESKFVVAGLEEDGWKVDAFIRVAPGVDVTQGSAAMIDTSRYSAVVALDGATLPYANRILEFARSGGGVVFTPQAASLDAMTPIRAGVVGRAPSEGRAIQVGGSVSLAALPLTPVTSLRSDAVPLERRAGAVAIAARRIGAGRALQLGYEDTWRWRMGGGEGAVRDHRVWWTDLVSRVAYAPLISRAVTTASTDAGSKLGLVAAVGPGTPLGVRSSLSGSSTVWTAWLFAVLALGLILEAASRRLRGAS